MTDAAAPRYSDVQIATWLRGLLTIAWVDGDFSDAEQQLIAGMTQDLGFADNSDVVLYKTLSPPELVEGLGNEPHTSENFLRTAVLVAIADGLYTPVEAKLLQEFSQALGIKVHALESLEHTLCDPHSDLTEEQTHPHPDLLHPIKHWLDDMDIHEPRIAHFICHLVPPQCPFERDIKLFGHKIVHIPPLCKLNPLYEQLVGLRFRALSYLADDCQEDISQYY